MNKPKEDGMRIIALLLVTLVVGCASDSLYDPTGKWRMTLAWGNGTCGLEDTSQQSVLVTRAGDDYLVASDDPADAASGVVTITALDATVDLTLAQADILDDGGSTSGELRIRATADESNQISGSGSVVLRGQITCQQSHSVTGILE